MCKYLSSEITSKSWKSFDRINFVEDDTSNLINQEGKSVVDSIRHSVKKSIAANKNIFTNQYILTDQNSA